MSIVLLCVKVAHGWKSRCILSSGYNGVTHNGLVGCIKEHAVHTNYVHIRQGEVIDEQFTIEPLGRGFNSAYIKFTYLSSTNIPQFVYFVLLATFSPETRFC